MQVTSGAADVALVDAWVGVKTLTCRRGIAYGREHLIIAPPLRFSAHTALAGVRARCGMADLRPLLDVPDDDVL